MNGLSSGTGRFAAPKIEVKCRCGKRYRVKATKAGKRVRCKSCRSQLEVPGAEEQGAISMRSRKAILAEFGIDADEAQERYQAEQDQTYACSVCSAEISEALLKTSYGPAGLTCAGCRSEKAAERAGEKSPEDVALSRWTRAGSPEAARRQALAKGALILVGTTCLLQFAIPVWGAGLIAAVLATAAGFKVYQLEQQG